MFISKHWRLQLCIYLFNIIFPSFLHYVIIRFPYNHFPLFLKQFFSVSIFHAPSGIFLFFFTLFSFICIPFFPLQEGEMSVLKKKKRKRTKGGEWGKGRGNLFPLISLSVRYECCLAAVCRFCSLLSLTSAYLGKPKRTLYYGQGKALWPGY